MISPPPSRSHRFNPPPGWPPPPPGWVPPATRWNPDPSWPTAPGNWHWWIKPEPSRIRHRHRKKRLRIIIAVMMAAIVVALGISIYTIKTSTAKTNTANGCVTWESSSDGQVFYEDESYVGYCMTVILRAPLQDGGIFNSDSGPGEPLHGSQVCSLSAYTPPNKEYGFKGGTNTDIIYKGSTGDSTEAENLCAYMKSVIDEGAS